MAELYRVSFQQKDDRKPEDWFAAQGLGGAMDRVRARANEWPKGPTRQRDRGDEWGPWRPNLGDALFHFKSSVEANRPGDIRVLQHENKALILVRNVAVPDIDYPSVSSNATPNVRRLIQPLWEEFPQLEYWGCFNCRRISGSSSFSEHAWADAIDIHAPSMSYGDDVNRWLNNNSVEYNITRVLWREANHYDHLHVDLNPDHSGYPPCV